MSALKRRLEKVERTAGAGEERGILIPLDPDYTEADIGLAYANAGLEQRESDQVVIIRMWSHHKTDPASGPYPFAQVVDFKK